MGKRSYEQLDLTERVEIYRLHADGKSLRFIAGAVGRSVSTISRELQRNSKASKQWAGGYDPQRAQELTRRRHARGRAHKLERTGSAPGSFQTPRRGMVARADRGTNAAGAGQRAD